MNNRASILKIIGLLTLAVIVFAGLIQLIPFGKDHANPAVVQEPKWDSPQTRALAKRACFDCHSNETTWPWYSDVAPVSWLIARDVQEGRQKMNLSDWGTGNRDVKRAAKVVTSGEMPPWYYVTLHPNASLSAEEKQQLSQGLQATFGISSGSVDSLNPTK